MRHTPFNRFLIDNALAIVGILLASVIVAGRISRWSDTLYPVGAVILGLTIFTFIAYLVVVVMYAVTDAEKVYDNRLLAWLEWKYKKYKNRNNSIIINGDKNSIIIKNSSDAVVIQDDKIVTCEHEMEKNKPETYQTKVVEEEKKKYPFPLDEIYEELNQENRPDADVIALTSGVHRQTLLLNTLEFYSNNLHLRSKGKYVSKNAGHICYCAIGRLLTNDELKSIVYNSRSNECALSLVKSILPDRIKMKGSDFLNRLQVLHDADMNWSLDGTLSEKGQEFLFNIIKDFKFNGESFRKYITDEVLSTRLNDYINR